jgi:UPF0755 protein
MIFSLCKLVYFFVYDFSIELVKLLARIVLLVGLALFISVYVYLSQGRPQSEEQLVQIHKSSSFSQVSKALQAKGLLKSPILFKLSARYLGYDRKIRAGEFRLKQDLTAFQLCEDLLNAKPELRKVTLIEGLRYSDIVPILADSLQLSVQKLTELFTDSALRDEFAISAGNIEGYIYPQTYLFEWGITEREVIRYLIKQTKSLLGEHTEQLDSMGFTENQLLTLASIIEAESNFADEKPTVSSVYHNRLRIGYKLQADPTIIYLLGKPQRVLFRHLRIDSPYNTYMYEGLPPTAINNPGRDAILAAIYPAKTSYLYFTGTGDGTGRHLFGKSLQEHNRNRKQLDQARRQK